MLPHRSITSDVRERNAALVYSVLEESDQVTRADLSIQTGLAVGTVRTILAQFLERGLVTPQGERAETGGRPTHLFALNAQRVAAILVAVTREGIEADVVDLATQVLWRGRVDISIDAGDAWRRAMSALVAAARTEVVAAYPSTLPVAVIVSIPTLVVQSRYVLGSLTAAPPQMDLAAELEDAAGPGVTVIVVNNGRLRALAAREQAARDRSCYVAALCSSADGVTGALLTDLTVFPGDHGLAGELGHLVVDHRGPRCRCGARGCLHQLTSTASLIDAGGLGDDLVRQTGGLPQAAPDGLDALIAHAEDGDQRVLDALATAGNALAAAVATLSNVTDVGLVILEGDYARLERWLRPPIDALIAERTRVNPIFNPRVLFRTVSDLDLRHAGLRIALDEFRAHPLTVPLLAEPAPLPEG